MIDTYVKIKYDTLRSAAFNAITTNYSAIGAQLAYPVRIFKLDNTTNGNLLVSFNGSTDNMFVSANTSVVFDFCANRSEQGGLAVLPMGGYVYAKYTGSSGTNGNVYVTIIYAAPA